MTMHRAILVCLSLIWSGPLAADTSQEWAAGVISRCIDTHGLESCIEVASQSCLATEGMASYGICLGAERAAWEARVRATMDELSARELMALNRAERRSGQEAPDLEVILEQFEAYREAACAFETADWEGMHTGPVHEACRLRMAAQHALWLERLVQR